MQQDRDLAREDLGHLQPLGPGNRHRYRLFLAAGVFLHIEIEQHGSDTLSRLLDPQGKSLIEVDSHTGATGTEHLVIVTRSSGIHTLEVGTFASSPDGGSYLARIVAERAATPRDRRYAHAASTFATAYTQAENGKPEALRAAAAGFRTAADQWRQLGELRHQAEALLELATVYRRTGHLRAAVTCYRRSLPLLASPADLKERAVTLGNLALGWSQLGFPHRARQSFRQARSLFHQLGDRSNEAAVQLNLGRLASRQGRLLAALRLLDEAAGSYRRAGERPGLVEALNVTGEVYGRLGEPELALDQHRQALELLHPVAEPRQRANTLGFLAKALLDAGDLEGAAAAWSEATALRQAAGDALGAARAWVGLGLVAEHQGQPGQAIELYRQALAVFQRNDALEDRAAVLNNLAWIYNRLGALQPALRHHRRALALFQRLGHHEGRAASLLGLARSRRLQGRPAAALRQAEAALAEIERVAETDHAAGDPLGLSFLASRQDYFDLVIELLMAQHREHTKAGLDARALAASEQSRARHLLASLGPRLPAAARQPATALRLRALKETIDREEEELRSWPANLRPLERASVEHRQRLQLAEYQRLTRDRRPSPASSNPDRTLGMEEIRQFLGADTLLLEYHLGEERSYLWLLSQNRLESFLLPPRAEVEELARRAYSLLMRSDRITHRVPAEQALRALSSMLLSPVAGKLADHRLAVVTGGALEYLPFAALPSPTDPRRRLVEEHEIVHLPSASVLAALRRRAVRRDHPSHLLAILGDPVFEPEDERLGGRAASPASPQLGLPALHRLHHASREAETIATVARSRGEVLVATGFDAQRQLVVGGSLSSYSILHFATHGVLHAEQPELSALVLSHYRADGSSLDGRLPLYEIASLHLNADLVVLSACRTALGKEVRGEGLLGLPRGFLSAGAQRVLVSLWNVDDESTAELMTRFYQQLLVAGRTPAAALRAAQCSMLTEHRYAPYHWAAFVLQGDWL